MQLHYPVHFGIRPKNFASSSVCSSYCLAAQLAHLSYILLKSSASSGKYARPSPWFKPPCPSCTSARPHVTTHCELKVEASNRLSRSMLALINRPHLPATQLREPASITDELPLVPHANLQMWVNELAFGSRKLKIWKYAGRLFPPLDPDHRDYAW
jgi:hypothetical protein